MSEPIDYLILPAGGMPAHRATSADGLPFKERAFVIGGPMKSIALADGALLVIRDGSVEGETPNQYATELAAEAGVIPQGMQLYGPALLAGEDMEGRTTSVSEALIARFTGKATE